MEEWGFTEDKKNTPWQWETLHTGKMTACQDDVKEIWAVVKSNDLNENVCNYSLVMETSSLLLQVDSR